MKLKYLLIEIVFFTLLINPNHLFSADAFVGLTVGAGTYIERDLSQLNREVIAQVPANVKIMSDFPPYFNFETEFGLQITKLNYIGVGYSHLATGAHSSYKDYSGEYYDDFQISGNSVNFLLYMKLYEKDKIKLFHWSELSYIFTSITMTEFNSIYPEKNKAYNLESANYGITLGFKGAYQFDNYDFGFKAGYFWGPQTRIKKSGTENYIVFLNSKEDVDSDWSGLRFGIYLNYHFELKIFKGKLK